VGVDLNNMNDLSKRLRKALSIPIIASSRRSQYFHPSSASTEYDKDGMHVVEGSCLREQYYRIANVESTSPSEPDYIFSALMGDKVSELIVELIDTHGFRMGLQRLAVEHSFYDERINVSGRSDLIFWDHNSSEVVGIEIKSVGMYKADQTLDNPDPSHIMQSVLYLDYYKNFIPPNQKSPKAWYIWYVARTENWNIKGKKHGSPMTMLWDYKITLDSSGVPTVEGAYGSKVFPQYSVASIHARYNKLEGYVEKNEIPPRDYDLQYSEEKLAALHKLNKLTRKMDKEKVEKWIAKGAPEGKLNLDLGDFACRLCSYKNECWNISSNYVQPKSDLPEEVPMEIPAPPEVW
jgi:hypothetical protein